VRIKRYLTKEVFISSVAILTVLMLIFTSQQFVRYLGDVVDGKIPADLMLTMVGLQLPPLIGFLLPLAFFLGILLAFGQLYVENELVVTRSVGLGDRDLARFLTPYALILAALAFVFTLWVAPWSSSTQQALVAQSSQRDDFSFIRVGEFQVSRDGLEVTYAADSSADSKTLSQLFIAKIPDDRQASWQLTTAKRAVRWQANNNDYLKLIDGSRYQVPAGDQSTGIDKANNWQWMTFDSFALAIEPEQQRSKNKIKALSSGQLLNNIFADDTHSIEQKAASWAEFHWRLAVPISIPLLILLAVPLARVEPRQGKFAKMLPALLLYMGYMVALLLGRGLIEDQKINHWLGLWWVHGAFAFYVAWQYRHTHKRVATKPDKPTDSKKSPDNPSASETDNV
jgi:lipopolysaccharide export system permease protein